MAHGTHNPGCGSRSSYGPSQLRRFRAEIKTAGRPWTEDNRQPAVPRSAQRTFLVDGTRLRAGQLLLVGSSRAACSVTAGRRPEHRVCDFGFGDPGS